LKTPAKPCNGRFSEDSIQILLKNVDRAQWLPHKCAQCGQLVGAKLEKGNWVPEPHWPSVLARRTSGSSVQRRRDNPAPQTALGGETDSTGSPPQHDGATSRPASVVTEAWNEILDPAAIPKLIEKPASAPPAPLRVFVVDDEFNIASTLGLILRHHGYEATSFTGPLEALQAIVTHPPDLLISDVAMPQLSGVELALKVRECAPSCKILLFSGESSSAGLVEAARAVGHTFELLSRPLHPVELLNRIQKLTEDAGLSASGFR